MSEPILILLAGPNGAGKSTFVEYVLAHWLQAGLPFVNADVLAAQQWPGQETEHAYEASKQAAQMRAELLNSRTSFITETVFSHESKLDLIKNAQKDGYRVHFHVILVPEELSVARVPNRVDNGGHHVPEEKIRARYHRLWPLVAEAIGLADQATVYDNTDAAQPFRNVAQFLGGQPATALWPTWTPTALKDLTPNGPFLRNDAS